MSGSLLLAYSLFVQWALWLWRFLEYIFFAKMSENDCKSRRLSGACSACGSHKVYLIKLFFPNYLSTILLKIFFFLWAVYLMFLHWIIVVNMKQNLSYFRYLMQLEKSLCGSIVSQNTLIFETKLGYNLFYISNSCVGEHLIAHFSLFFFQNFLTGGIGTPECSVFRLVTGTISFCLLIFWATYSGNLIASLAGKFYIAHCTASQRKFGICCWTSG